MRKIIILIFFALSILLVNAAENESVENTSLENASDLTAVDFGQTVNETQVDEISDVGVVGNDSAAVVQEAIPIIEQTNLNSDSIRIQSGGRRPVIASIGVYLQIAG